MAYVGPLKQAAKKQRKKAVTHLQVACLSFAGERNESIKKIFWCSVDASGKATCLHKVNVYRNIYNYPNLLVTLLDTFLHSSAST